LRHSIVCSPDSQTVVTFTGQIPPDSRREMTSIIQSLGGQVIPEPKAGVTCTHTVRVITERIESRLNFTYLIRCMLEVVQSRL